MADELFISVDIESDGPAPGLYSMYELGACLVDDDRVTFSTKLALLPGAKSDPEALAACGRTLDSLRAVTTHPVIAMGAFDAWVRAAAAVANTKPVFVGFAAPYDWLFVHWYFHRFVGDSPFGFAGLDVKAYYMGLSGCRWDETSKSKIDPRFQPTRPHTHDALDDALRQAEIFRRMRAHRAALPPL